jgi:hypothetical protein
MNHLVVFVFKLPLNLLISNSSVVYLSHLQKLFEESSFNVTMSRVLFTKSYVCFNSVTKRSPINGDDEATVES